MYIIRNLTLSAALLGSTTIYAGTPQTIQFAKGKSETTISGIIKGYDDAQYQLQANAGQLMSADILKGDVYANIYAPGDKPGEAEAIYNGSTNESGYISLPSSGKYTVQVYQMRAQARNERKEPFILKVSIKNKSNQKHTVSDQSSSIQGKSIQFAKGSSQATVSGKIKGYEDVRYRIRANAGQTLSFTLNNASLYLKVYAPGDLPGEAEAISNGDEAIILPQTGEYILQVYQMRNDARKGKNQPFNLNVSIR